MSLRDPQKYLYDIINGCEFLLDFTRGRTIDDYWVFNSLSALLPTCLSAYCLIPLLAAPPSDDLILPRPRTSTSSKIASRPPLSFRLALIPDPLSLYLS